ncbi:UDP-N-acetylmuramate dehydrogenase [Pseudoteredinibacter isoporae]|uniref:UDP-N-acetylenolpyruvoylglucosamine reductase n=1 Tax=Pseudoteredinibacter isoporae TaxID=570281 RepID=A0A7X0JV87_9GAMM|nr:UDP-N-acetylmuramate dehydrogenase [Pseudoteredinibacter isoporae]MBB6521931.1 UDP-N-acetylmuramate dehydrogenase [Pseudoteredinibacter isoporae]NHO87468.1 UDP-N-acetylmuramate dehydrogenase [Pseudoteredinibacter isoporae]NIB24201.1 UDP-N-acetylmuramate dehydrogenase [Pseudoteredinibacter isoporae]
MALIEHQDLSNFNTLAIQAEARFYWAIQSFEDLQAALDWYRSENANMPLLVLGGGSNVILSDHFPGLVLHMQNQGITLLEELSDSETVYLDVDAGENWHELVCHCCEQGWYGLENLALIPGAAGAAPIQNIGAYGVELCDVMDSLECLEIDSGKHYRLSAEQCQFAYRDSIFKQAGEPRRIISRIRLRLRRGAQVNTRYPGLQQSLQDLGVHPEQANPKDILQAVCNLRRVKLPDPAELPNVGSFFKNPIVSEAHYQQLKAEYADLVAYPHGDDYKLAAGWLIDQAGWKGHREEQVAVHERQALVLVNYNKGSAKEVLMLAKKIQDDIWQRYHVALEIEPRHILASGELAQD